jgi:hypothetical protein
MLRKPRAIADAPVSVTLQRRCDRLRDVVLHGEDIDEVAVVALRPEMRTVPRVHELHPSTPTRLQPTQTRAGASSAR